MLQILVIAALLVCGAVQAMAGQRTALPPTIDPFDVESVLLAGLDPGQALTPAAWRDVEDLYLVHQGRVEQDVDPRERELLRAAPPQEWMNWPALKPTAIRSMRNAAADAVIAADQAFFEDLEASWMESAPDLALAARRAALRWELLQRSEPGMLHFRRIVDVESLVRAAVEMEPLSVEDRSAIHAALQRFVAERLARLRERVTAWRRAESAFETALAREGLVVEQLHGESNPDIARAFELWSSVAAPFVTLAEREIVASRAFVDDIALRLPPRAAEVLRANYRARESDVAGMDASPSPLAFARFVESGTTDATPEEIAAIWVAVDAWTQRDSTLVRKIAAASSTLQLVEYWPLWGSGWWADKVHAADCLHARSERAREREESRTAFWRLLREGNGVPGNGRGEALWNEYFRARKIDETRETRRRPIWPWASAPVSGQFATPNADRLWLNDGVIVARDFDPLLDFVVGPRATLSADFLPTARTLRDDAEARFRERLQEIPEYAAGLNTWSFGDRGYVHRTSFAATIAAQSIPVRHDLRQIEESLFDAIAALVEDRDARARLRIVRALRAIDRERVVLRGVPRDTRDERDRANPGGVALLALAGCNAETVDPIATALEVLAQAQRTRADDIEDEVLAVMTLDDGLMWVRYEIRVTREAQVASTRNAATSADERHRPTSAAHAEAVMAMIRAHAPEGAVRVDELWDALAFGGVLSGVPPARALLRTAPCDVSAIAARFEERDHALRAELRARAAVATLADDPELDRLTQRRRAASDLAECAVRIECAANAAVR